MARDDCTVKHYLSTHSGAPVLNGVAGSRVGVLDACLVTGWGVTAVTQVVIAGGVATASFASGHPFAVHQVLTLAGASPVPDGQYRVRTSTGSAITFGVDDAIADQTITTGGMTLAVAPAGWETLYSSGLKRAYRSANALAVARFCYRFDDSAAQYARVTGYVSMSNIDTGVEPFASADGGGYVPGSYTSDITTRNWAVVSDGRLTYMLFCSHGGYPVEPVSTAFGEPLAYLSGDLFCAVVATGQSNNVAYGSPGTGNPSFDNGRNSEGWVVARNLLSGPGPAGAVAHAGTDGGQNSGHSTHSPTTLGPPVVLPMFIGSSGASIRGDLPGLMYSACYLGTRAGYNTMGLNAATAGPLAGRQYLLCPSGGYNNPSEERHYWIDCTGPWR